MMRRIEMIALFIFPLIALTIVILVFRDATAAMETTWQNGGQP